MASRLAWLLLSPETGSITPYELQQVRSAPWPMADEGSPTHNLQPDAGPGDHCQAEAQVGSGTSVKAASGPTEGERGGSLPPIS